MKQEGILAIILGIIIGFAIGYYVGHEQAIKENNTFRFELFNK
jgi:uncharacterized protein YneF (UPF0154 family)